MCIVAPTDRLASAAVVFFGAHGDISQQAQLRHVSPPSASIAKPTPSFATSTTATSGKRLARPATAGAPGTQTPGQQTPGPTTLPRPHRCRQAGRIRQHRPGRRRQFARSPAVSAAVFLGQRTPSVAALGRLAQQAGTSAPGLLLGRCGSTGLRPRRPEAAAGRNLLWLQAGAHGRRTPEPLLACSRSPVHQPRRRPPGPANSGNYPLWSMWARDGGHGSWPTAWRGVNQERQENYQPVIGDQLDHFHTLREGGRVLRKTPRPGRAGLDAAAEEADKKVAQQDRQGQALTGYATQSGAQVAKRSRGRTSTNGKRRRAFSSRFARNCSPLPLQES